MHAVVVAAAVSAFGHPRGTARAAMGGMPTLLPLRPRLLARLRAGLRVLRPHLIPRPRCVLLHSRRAPGLGLRPRVLRPRVPRGLRVCTSPLLRPCLAPGL
jgi:hypothetical protein